MLLEKETQVLVIGAGPVGMLTAICLGEEGIRVKVLEKESSPASKSYACALHPGTLKLLRRLGLDLELVSKGCAVDKIAIYRGAERQGEVRLADLPLEFPFILVVPQCELESVLARRVDQLETVDLNWNSRLSSLVIGESGISGTVDRLGQTVVGYSVPHWEGTVEKSYQIDADFLVGADGVHSLVRRSLGIELQPLSTPEFFTVYEFISRRDSRDEMRIVLERGTASVMWPISEETIRWSFQLQPGQEILDFPEKERHHFSVHEFPSEDDSGHHLAEMLKTRAPWFEGRPDEIEWSTQIQFQHRLATRFGKGRCWLAGDAAHQTGPVGVQSMNVGLREGATLARLMAKILHEDASIDALERYNTQAQEEWKFLLGIGTHPKAKSKTEAWLDEYDSRLLSCLPASGEDLTLLLNALGMELQRQAVTL